MSFITVDERKKRLLHLSSLWLQASVLIAALLLPLLLLNQNEVSAAQLTSRSVTISTSKVSVTANYVIAFTTPVTTNIGSVIVQSCTTPLGTCTAPTAQVINIGANATWTGTSATNFTRTTSATGACAAIANNQFCGTRTAVSETNGAKTLTITGATNPSATGSFFLRITTYSDAAYATPVDSGVVAGAIVAQLTVNARIQEILNFCVGATAINDATTTPGADCSAITGTTVDIGVLDAGTINISPVTTNGGTSNNGIAMLRTNAQNGAVISYFSEQNTSSGTLKVAGAACGDITPSTGSSTDQCINSAATQGTFTAGTEEFGMTVAGTNCGSTTAYTCVYTAGSNKLDPTGQYIGAGSNAYGTTNGFAWDASGTAATIATSPTVVDDEALILRFAATPAITTPTGAYTVTSTYIATVTY